VQAVHEDEIQTLGVLCRRFYLHTLLSEMEGTSGQQQALRVSDTWVASQVDPTWANRWEDDSRRQAAVLLNREVSGQQDGHESPELDGTQEQAWHHS
jgi:hypothetical protein